MDPIIMDVDELVKKWQEHHNVPTETDENPWYKQKPKYEYDDPYDPVARRRFIRKLRSKRLNRTQNNITQVPRKFQLQPPVLANNVQNYEVSYCKQCQNSLKYLPKEVEQCYSQTKNLYTTKQEFGQDTLYDQVEQANTKLNILMLFHNFTKVLVKISTNILKNWFNVLCYQNKDRTYLQQLSNNPIIYVHDSDDTGEKFIIYLYIAVLTNTIPFAIIDGTEIKSSFLRWILQCMGFILLEDDMNEQVKEAVIEDIMLVLRCQRNLLISLPKNTDTASPTNFLEKLFSRFKLDRELLMKLYAVPISISLEYQNSLSPINQFSLFAYSTQHFFKKRRYHGLVQVNFGKAIQFQSLQTVARSMDPPNEDEENMLMIRHLRYDILQCTTILPVHIVSFLLITKYRDGVLLDTLINEMEEISFKLKDVNRFLGFRGETRTVMRHAIELLGQQQLVKIDGEDIVPVLDVLDSVQLFYKYSIKVGHVFMLQSIMASSVISCLGGFLALTQRNEDVVTCKKVEIFERVQYLSELISYLVDYYCPYTEVESSLDEVLRSLEMVSTKENNYEDLRHQKLVQSFHINHEWDNEDDDGATPMISSYENIECEVLVDEFNAAELKKLRLIVQPYIELCYVIMSVIRETAKESILTYETIYEAIRSQFEKGHFLFGEVVSLDLVSRFFDYCYEKEVIDEFENGFVLSETYKLDDFLISFMYDILQFR